MSRLEATLLLNKHLRRLSGSEHADSYPFKVGVLREMLVNIFSSSDSASAVERMKQSCNESDGQLRPQCLTGGFDGRGLTLVAAMQSTEPV